MDNIITNMSYSGKSRSSPLNIRGIKTKVSTKQIIQSMRQIRHRKPAPRQHQKY